MSGFVAQVAGCRGWPRRGIRIPFGGFYARPRRSSPSAGWPVLELARHTIFACCCAKVNQALLYYYFQSKEELHRFTLEMLFSQLRAQAAAALERPAPPGERLRGYINAYFDFVAAHPNYPRLVERELMSRGPRLGGIVEEFFRPLYSRLTATIRRWNRPRRIPAGGSAGIRW